MQFPLSVRPVAIALPLLTLLIPCVSAVAQDAPVAVVPQDAPLTEAQNPPLTEAPNAPTTALPTTAVQEVGPMLPNGDFSLPRVPDEAKFLPQGRPQGWNFDIKSGGPGIAVEYWNKERTPFFYWNNPNGSISQTVNAGKSARPKEGETLQLSYFYGALGKAKPTLVAAILIDGKPVTSATHEIEPKAGGPQTPATLPYTIKKEDVGKSVGVSFTWTSDQGKFVQGSLKNVVFAVSPTATEK